MVINAGWEHVGIDGCQYSQRRSPAERLQTIQRFVDAAIASLAGSRIKEFVPLFVNRFARERLRALALVQAVSCGTSRKSCSYVSTLPDEVRWRQGS